MPGCFVKGCNFTWRQKDPTITLHVFPRKPERTKKWLQQIYGEEESLDDMVIKIHNRSRGAYRICSKHFAPECYESRDSGKILKCDALPTIFPWTEDHPYAKRKKLQTDKTTDTVSTEATVYLSVPSTSKSIPTPQEFVMSQLASSNLPKFPNTNDCTAEDGGGSLSEDSYTRKRPYQPWGRRATDLFNCLYTPRFNKGVQYDRSMGSKHRAVQVRLRPSQRSIALQCNLANLPKLSRATKSSEDPSTDPSFVEGSMSVQVMEEEEEPMSPGMSDSPGLQSDTMDQLDLNQEEVLLSESERPKEKYSSYVEVEVKKESQECPEVKSVIADPKDIDTTPILLPESRSPTDHVNERKFIVFESCLDKLFMCCKCLGMTNCPGKIVKVKKYRIGSAVLVTAVCSLKHEFYLWTSQPMIGRMPAGNLLISSGVLCSGSSFHKLESFFHLVGVLGISHSTYIDNQNLYLFPAIDHHWKLERRSIMQGLQRRPVALVGDFKSSTSRAKCCTYSFLEFHTKKIIDFQLEESDHSVAPAGLEEKTFQTAFDRLLNERLNVRVICTARRARVRKLLMKHYSHIKHQYDTWHVARFIAGKILRASRNHGCHQLSRWIKPIKKHLWWSARTCEHNPTLLREKWSSIVYHAANQHQWPGATMYDSCYHKEEKYHQEWLKAGSEAHQQLKKVVLNKNLLKDLKHLSDFCHPEELEVFNSISRKYHAKRTRYSIDGLMACSQLAALDYNWNIHRIQNAWNMVCEGQGAQNWHSHNHTGNNWVLSNIYKPSNQNFIKEILADVLSVAAGTKRLDWTSREVTRKVTPSTAPSGFEMLNQFIHRVP